MSRKEMSYKILIDEKEIEDVFGIQVELGINNLRMASFGLPNHEGQHNNISHLDPLEVWLGNPLTKFFVGKIETLENLMEEGDFLFIEGFGHGSILFDKPLTKEYENINGKTIIKDAIALTDLNDAQVDPDNEIATNFTREYDQTPAFEVIQEICRQSAKSDGTVGFYFFIDINKVVHVYPYDKFTSTKVIERGVNMAYLRRKSISSVIKNKIWFYGGREKFMPSDFDAWTESLTDWTADYGTLGLEDTIVQVGDYSIRCISPEIAGPHVVFNKAFSTLECIGKGYTRLRFSLRYGLTAGTLMYIQIVLYDSENDYFFRYFCGQDLPNIDTWKRFDLPLGPVSEGAHITNQTSTGWVKHGTPNWHDIVRISFALDTVSFDPETLTVYIDNLFFGPARFSNFAQDDVSIGKYGMKSWVAPIDEKIVSDAECLIVAKEWLKRKKLPSKLFKVQVDCLLNIPQGYLLRVKDLLVHNIDEKARILEVKHSLSDEGLNTSFDVSLEPLGFSPMLLLTERRLKQLDEGLKRKA